MLYNQLARTYETGMSRDRMPIAMPSRIWESCQNPSNRLHRTERIAILVSQAFIVSRNSERSHNVTCSGAYRRGEVVTPGRNDRNRQMEIGREPGRASALADRPTADALRTHPEKKTVSIRTPHE